jgi:hypothetical protein
VPSGGWSARCPAHDDQVASLSVTEAADGKVLLHCHAGCDTGAVVEALALPWAALFPDRSDRSEPRAVYEYTDEDGALLFQVVRFPPKDFRQRRPDGNGGWVWKLGDVRRVLYRLPQVTNAAGAGNAVFVVEGERDAERLASLGLVATTNPGGAGKWRRVYSDHLRGAHVLILPDNDAPGRKHAQQVARALYGIAASVKVVSLPGLPEKGDVSAWLDAGHGARDLLERVKEAPSWTPAHGGMGKQATSSERSAILVREELNAVTDEAIAALLATNQPVFVRSRALVTVARDGSPQHRWLQRPPGSPVIVGLDAAQTLGFLDAAAAWVKPTRKGDRIPSRPPKWVAEQVLARREWPFPYLEAVIEVPTLRPDGTVLDTPGWDESTGLLYDPMPGITWPAVPAQPSAQEVRAALEALLDPVTEFPFVSTSDRAAYLAAVLTLLVRHLIRGPVPLFAVRAPTPATGKGLLVMVIAEIATGRPAAVSSLTEEAAEWRKLLLTVALEGTPVVVLDNLSGAVGSNHLAAALTATEWMDRRLGVNAMVRAPLTTVWFCTGNNLAFKKTLGRRVIPLDLDAKVERPEDRTFLGYILLARLSPLY